MSIQYDTSGVPVWHRWLLSLDKAYWPRWLREHVLDGKIEVCVYHRDRLDAAHVVRDYAEHALERSLGHRFQIDVWVRSKSVPPTKSPDQAFAHVRDELGYAADCNVVCLPHCDNVGGGSAAKVAVDTPWRGDPDVGDLRGHPVQHTACGPPYGQLSSCVHEIGHCLGWGHDDGTEVTINGRQYASPMPYSNLDCYVFEYMDWDTGDVDVQKMW